jgi:hypothetical protein
MTYAKIGPEGGLIPTIDRDEHIMEAAAELGRIDWAPYLTNGLWNDTHDEGTLVGVPTNLEFHDASTPLAKAHGKVGFWTAGHLFDRADPSSWELYTSHVPTANDLDRADYFWQVAQMLKGLPRPLGFSAHGDMALSPCRRRIVWCRVKQAAVCDLPKNPDATAELLKGSPLELLRKGLAAAVEEDPEACEACDCETCRKGVGSAAPPAPVEERAQIAQPAPEDGFTPTGSLAMDNLTRAVMRRFFVDQATAERWIRRHFQRSRTGGSRG